MIGQGVAEVRGPVEAPAMPGMPRGQLVWGGLAFVALTGGVKFWWLFDRVPAGQTGLRWADLEGATSRCSSWRCRSRRSRQRCASGSSAACSTRVSRSGPASGPSGPTSRLRPSPRPSPAAARAQIYILRRDGGVSVGTGLTATLLSFMGTMAGLLLLGVYSLLAGVGANGRLFLAPMR